MIEFKPYSKVYEAEVLALLEPLWGNMDIHTRKAYFQWKYLDNPASDKVLAFLAFDTVKNKVIGFRGFFPSNYSLNDHLIKVASFSDVVIHPDYRKRGLFAKLTIHGIKELAKKQIVNYYYSTSSAGPTSNGYIKLGAVKLANKRELYHLRLLKKTPKNKKLQFEFSQQLYPDSIASLHSSICQNQKISLQRDSIFLNWRYQNPAANYYFVYAWQNDNLVGYISFYKINTKRCFILDYAFLNPSFLRPLLKYVGVKSSCRILQMWSISKDMNELKLLKKNGFMNLNIVFQLLGKSTASPILIRPAIYDYAVSDFVIEGKDVQNHLNWNLNLICSDGV